MTLIVFIGVNVIGNPVDILINPDLNQAERLRVIENLGLDQSLWRQYLSFLHGLTQGSFGDSFVYGRPALDVILERLPATLERALCAMVIAIVVGLPLGLYDGLDPGLLAPDLLGRADVHPRLRGTAWMAAVERAR